jgi:hypothetical protein
MWSDPIVDEVRAEAKQWADQFQGDVRAMFAEIRRLEKLSGEKFITLPPRPPRETKASIAPLSISPTVDNPQQFK